MHNIHAQARCQLWYHYYSRRCNCESFFEHGTLVEITTDETKNKKGITLFHGRRYTIGSIETHFVVKLVKINLPKFRNIMMAISLFVFHFDYLFGCCCRRFCCFSFWYFDVLKLNPSNICTRTKELELFKMINHGNYADACWFLCALYAQSAHCTVHNPHNSNGLNPLTE